MAYGTQQVSGPVTDAQMRASELPVSVGSLPLPAGAAQDGTDIKLPTPMPHGGAGIRGWLSAIWTKLNGSLAVTGPLTAAELHMTPLSVAVSGAMALPTGGSTSAKQSDGSQKTQIVDGSGNVVGSTASAIDVNIKSGVAVSVTPAPANNSWGQSLAVTAAATATIVSIPTSAAGYQVRGFVVHGTGDGYFFAQVAGVTILSARTRSTLPAVVVPLPNGVPIPTGSAVALKVTNESGSTADFEATLLGV